METPPSEKSKINNPPQGPIHEKLALVPAKPGVYLMRDGAGHIIYIGKAKALRARLGSYFKSGSHDAKVTAMLERVRDFDYFITKTENDALGLEANLVKKHQPHYNILLKDSKTFPYIKVTDGDWPYLEVTRKLTKGGKYFGPYFNGIWASELLDTLLDIFPLRTCSKVEFAKKTPCINHQIGRCLAPCAKRVTREECLKIIDDVKSFLRGEREFGAREKLQSKMENAAALEQFEIAIRYRNGMNFLDKLRDRTITHVARDLNADVFSYAIRGDVFVVSVLSVRAGKLIGIQNFSEQHAGVQSEEDMLSGFVMQYYQQNVVPEQIVAEFPMTEVAVALGCTIFNPKVALKRQLLDMAKTNADEYIDTSIEKIKFREQFTVGAVDELGTVLGLTHPPKKIECYDISHTDGTDMVASMVVFINGVAEKKLYRRFKIKHGMGNNDFLSMQEVITRRLARIGTPDISFGIAPDLIVIDGGKGQLSSVMDVAGNSEINFIALAKENEEIFKPGESTPLVLSKRSYSLRLLQRVRDEAHRFANTFHRNLRAKRTIPGLK